MQCRGTDRKLAAPDLVELQRRAGLPAAPALRSLSAWRSALRANPNRHALWIQIDSPFSRDPRGGAIVLSVAGRELFRGPLRRQGAPQLHVFYARIQAQVESASPRVRVRLEAPALGITHDQELDLARGRFWIVSHDRAAGVKIEQRANRPLYR